MWEDFILFAGILTFIFILVLIVLIIRKFFPESAISDKIERIAEWISDNVKF